MSIKKPVNKLLERVKDQEKNIVTAAKWPAQGGLFGAVNRNAPEDLPADAPTAGPK